MSDEKTTEDFLDAIAAGNFNQAKQWFDDEIGNRVQDALDAEKINVADQIFNKSEEPDDLDVADDVVDDEDDMVFDELDDDTAEDEGKLIYSGAYEDDESIPEE